MSSNNKASMNVRSHPHHHQHAISVAQSSNQQNVLHRDSVDKRWGAPPPGYIPGRGRGATGFVGGVSRDEVDRDQQQQQQNGGSDGPGGGLNQDLSDANFDSFSGYGGSLFGSSTYDKDDQEADLIYSQIDSRMDSRRAKWRDKMLTEELKKVRAQKPTIKQQFADLTRGLEKVSEEEWNNIPECQERLKEKKRQKRDNFSAVPDSVFFGQGLAGPKGVASGNATPLGLMSGGASTPLGMMSSLGSGGAGSRTPLGMATPLGMMSSIGGGNSSSMFRGGFGGAIGSQTPLGMATPLGLAGSNSSSNSKSNSNPSNTQLMRWLNARPTTGSSTGPTITTGGASGSATPMTAQSSRPLLSLGGIAGNASSILSGGAAGNQSSMGGMITPAMIGDWKSQKRSAREAAGMTTPLGMQIGGAATPMGGNNMSGSMTSLGSATPMSGSMTSLGVSDFAMAKGHNLSMKLGEIESKVSNVAKTDIAGYFTDLNQKQGFTASTDIQDINKARALMSSVTSTNPKHAPGWIAAARLEEFAGRLGVAKELIIQGTKKCSKSEDIWLEAARLEGLDGQNNGGQNTGGSSDSSKGSVSERALNRALANAKAVIAAGVKENPNSMKLWLKAAELELDKDRKSKVLRKALDFIPNSETLWKEAISIEDEENAKILLLRATICVPNSVELWLGLAKLCSYSEAQKVLNEARKKIPTSAEIWLCAAKLQEKGEGLGYGGDVDKFLPRALDTLENNGVTMDRETWLKHAENAEATNYPKTCIAICKHTILLGLGDQQQLDRDPKTIKRIWIQDAESLESRGSIATARAIYEAAVSKLPYKKGLWRRFGELEIKHGNKTTLEQVLERGCKACPKSEVLWLMLAKQKWLANDVDGSRAVLNSALRMNQDDMDRSESIYLAAAKLEVESGYAQRARKYYLEVESGYAQRARLLLEKARNRGCTSAKIWQQSVQLERESQNYAQARALCEEGLKTHQKYSKLWMIYGQLSLEDPIQGISEATRIFDEGLQQCPRSIPLWLCAVDCQISQKQYSKARAILEKARLRNPNSPLLWYRGVEIEELDAAQQIKIETENSEATTLLVAAGTSITGVQTDSTSIANKMAHHILNRGLQECPSSGILWAKAVQIEPIAGKNAKSVDALRHCENDPSVMLSVAELFWREGKISKARKWLQRATSLSPRWGDGWALFLVFELIHGSLTEQREILQKVVEHEPNRGLIWPIIVKKPKHWRLKILEKLRKYIEVVYPREWAAVTGNKSYVGTSTSNGNGTIISSLSNGVSTVTGPELFTNPKQQQLFQAKYQHIQLSQYGLPTPALHLSPASQKSLVDKISVAGNSSSNSSNSALDKEIQLLLYGETKEKAREETRRRLQEEKEREIREKESKFTLDEPFIGPLVGFEGYKKGYVFKLDWKGLGYYEDVGYKEYVGKS